MIINKNLLNLNSYTLDMTDIHVYRHHANESNTAILSTDILTQNIMQELHKYPEEKYIDLIFEAAKFYNINTEYIIPVNGSDEGLDLIIRTFANTNDNIVVLQPTFSMYKQYIDAFGGKAQEFKLDQNFELDSEKFIDFCMRCNAKIVFIPNPLAPTGGLVRIQNLIKIIQNLPNTFVVIDEAYIEFTKSVSTISLLSKYSNLIATRTLSKFFGLAGIRLGFVFTRYKSELMKIKSPYNVSQMTCTIGINLFQNLTKIICQHRYSENILNKKKMIRWLSQFNDIERIYESHTNFLFIKLKDRSDIFEKKLLYENNMKIRTFNQPFKNFCRISF